MGSLKERAFLLKTHATVSGVKKHIDVNILQFIRKKSLRIFLEPVHCSFLSRKIMYFFWSRDNLMLWEGF